MSLSNFIGWNNRKKNFPKKLNVVGIKCREKSENKLSHEEKVLKVRYFFGGNWSQQHFLFLPLKCTLVNNTFLGVLI